MTGCHAMPQVLQDILFIFLVAVGFVALYCAMDGALHSYEIRRTEKQSNATHDQ